MKMKKHVLDVGNCGPDHNSIKSMLTRFLDAEVSQAHETKDAIAFLSKEHIDLVLVNRKLDIDYSDGLDVIKSIKSDPRFANIPVMLVSNMEEYQEQAVAIGAHYGFGKLALGDPQTHERIRAALESTGS